MTVKNLETLQEPADHVLHYTQDVLISTTDGKKYVSNKAEAFSLKEAETKKVSQSEKLKDLAKTYAGFSYSWGTQKGKTVYLYYTRKTVTYSFYNGAVLIATRAGTYGLECAPPPVSLGGKTYAKTWNTSMDGAGLDLGKEFGAVDALFYPKGTYNIIGTKFRPQAISDIVFSDGSAALTQEVSEAKTAAEKSGATQAEKDLYDSYKNNAIAMILFVSYNPDTGLMNGDKMIGVGLRAFDSRFSGESCLGPKWREASTKDWVYEFPSYYGLSDVKTIKAVCPAEASSEGGDTSNMRKNFTAMYFAENYPTLCESKMSVTLADELKENWYLPSMREIAHAIGKPTAYFDTIANAARALGINGGSMGTDGIANVWFWSTSSKVESGIQYARAFKYGQTYSVPEWDDKLEGMSYFADNEPWRKVSHSYRVLPFKVFK